MWEGLCKGRTGYQPHILLRPGSAQRIVWKLKPSYMLWVGAGLLVTVFHQPEVGSLRLWL